MEKKETKIPNLTKSQVHKQLADGTGMKTVLPLPL